MALARAARKNPRKGVVGRGRCVHMKTKGKGRKGMHGMGRKGMHGMGLMKGLGFLKSASKALKKGLKKKNVKKLLNTVEAVADVAGDFAVTEEGKARAQRVKDATGQVRSADKKIRKATSGKGMRYGGRMMH